MFDKIVKILKICLAGGYVSCLLIPTVVLLCILDIILGYELFNEGSLSYCVYKPLKEKF